MTNKEKFEAVFGVSPIEFGEINWNDEYRGKLKHYEARMTDIYYKDRLKRRITFLAKNKTDARKKAIAILGEEYKRYESGHPQYALHILEGM